jgi:CIC family chloride channel protein
VLEGAIHGEYVVGLLLAFLAGKIIATSLTMAIGGSGGVFAPSLFIGAMLGSSFGAGAHDLLPGVTAGAGAYGLVGMAAVFAAAGRAPITAVLIVFELTGDYSIILPLMLAVVIATGLSKLLSEDSIYTLKLRRRGIDIEKPAPAAGVLGGIEVASAMRPGPSAVRAEAAAADVAARLAAEGRDALPVVDLELRVIGVVGAAALERALEEGGEASAGELAEAPPPLRPDDDLGRAVIWLAEGERSALPVLADDGGMVGWLEHRDILRAYADANAPRQVGKLPRWPTTDRSTR